MPPDPDPYGWEQWSGRTGTVDVSWWECVTEHCCIIPTQPGWSGTNYYHCRTSVFYVSHVFTFMILWNHHNSLSPSPLQLHQYIYVLIISRMMDPDQWPRVQPVTSASIPQKLLPTTMLISYTLIGVSVSEDLWEIWSSSAAVCERKEIVECLNAAST